MDLLADTDMVTFNKKDWSTNEIDGQYSEVANKMVFFSQYSPRERCYANTGNKLVNTYIGSYTGRGVLKLTPSGQMDLYAQIQSYKDSVDINTIVERYVSGDTSVMSRVQGIYADVYNMPSNLAELYALNTKLEQSYNALSAEQKLQVGTLDDYVSKIGTPELDAILNPQPVYNGGDNSED